MDIKQINCRNCSAPMHYEPGMTRIKCPFCGTEYALQNDVREQAVQDITDGVGCLFRTYLPAQWQARTRVNDKLFSMDAALCMDLILTSPDNSVLLMNPFAYFKDSRTPLSGGDGQLNPLTMQRILRRKPAEEYISDKIKSQFPGSSITSIKKSGEEDELLKKRAAGFEMQAQQTLKSAVDMSWGCYEVLLSQPGGRTQKALFAMIQAARQELQKPAEPQEQPKPQQNGGIASKLKSFIDYGMSGGLLGHLGNSSGSSPFKMPDLSGLLNRSGADWASYFDIILVCSDAEQAAAHDIMKLFIANIQYGARYYQLQQEEAERATQIALDGQRQRQQIAFNGWQRVHQTQMQTSDIINEGYAQRSATMDRTFQNVSQGIRGVDTYETAGGRSMEADVKYEHIYQRGDTFVGSTDGSLSLGPDWVEIKKK